MKKILLIEDEMIAQRMIKGLLKKLGYDLIIASTGKEGVDKATQEIGLIILDIGLPDYGREAGIRVAQEIRAKGSYFEKIPIVVLTANQEKELLTKIIEAGVDDYLNKPVNYDQLRKIVDLFLWAATAA